MNRPTASSSRRLPGGLFLLLLPALGSAQPVIRMPDARVGEPYHYGAVFEGLVEPIEFTWSPVEPPAGMRFQGPILTGTPQEAAVESYRLRLAATDALDRPNASLVVEYELRVRPADEPLRFCGGELPIAYLEVPYSQRLCAEGGRPPYRWSAGKLPSWMDLDSTTGVLRGLPARIGQAPIQVRLHDSAQGEVQPLALSVAVAPAPGPTLELVPQTLPPTLAGQPYSADIVATGAQANLSWAIDWQQRPDWLDVEFEGNLARLRSEKALEGEAVFSLRVTDSANSGAEDQPIASAASSYRLQTLGRLPEPVEDDEFSFLVVLWATTGLLAAFLLALLSGIRWGRNLERKQIAVEQARTRQRS